MCNQKRSIFIKYLENHIKVLIEGIIMYFFNFYYIFYIFIYVYIYLVNHHLGKQKDTNSITLFVGIRKYQALMKIKYFKIKN